MDLETLKEEHKSRMESLKEAVHKRDEEIDELGEATSQTKERVSEAYEQLEGLGDDLKELYSEHEDLKEAFSEATAKSNRPGFGGEGDERKTLGEAFVESEAYDRMQDAGSKSSDPVDVSSFLKKVRSGGEGGERKDNTVSGDSGSAGPIIDPFRVPQIFSQPTRPFRLRDLITVNQTQERQVEFIEESGFNHLYTEIDSAVSGGDTTVSVDNAQGFFDGQTITLSPGDPAEEEATVQSVNYDTGQLTLTSGTANGHAVDQPVVSDAFAYTPEAQLMPQASASFTNQTEGMRTLAHAIPATRQILRNRNMLRQHIDTRMVEGLSLSEERHILYGDGSNQELQGLLTHPRVQEYKWSNGTTGDSKVDAIRRAMTLALLAHYPVDGIVVNPQDWEDIETQKGDDGHYILVSLNQPQNRIWRAPVVVSTAIKPGDFALGAWRMGTAIWDGMQASIRVAEQHKDYATRNKVAIIAEQDATMTTYRPDSFVHGQFDAAP